VKSIDLGVEFGGIARTMFGTNGQSLPPAPESGRISVDQLMKGFNIHAAVLHSVE
jgi:hypothetical protein